MNITEFMLRFEQELEENKDGFLVNMEDDDLGYCDWIMAYIAWMGWGSKRDCELANWDEDEDDEDYDLYRLGGMVK